MLGIIWKPDLFATIDGRPLSTSLSDIYRYFPYERLTKKPFLAFALRPEVMLALVLLYTVSKPMFKLIATYVDSRSQGFRAVIALHNLGLAVFSAVLAWNSWGVSITHFANHGFLATYCDYDGTFWNAGGLGAWAIIFYLSKYYEFIDTWVLVLKGKQPSFLQVYHHTGVVISCWGAVISQGTWIMMVILLNSVIHTLMYTYFLIKTISPMTEIKAAKNLTMAQIGQFITALAFTGGIHFMDGACASPCSRFFLTFTQLYGIGLIVLFLSFMKQKYKTKDD